MRLDRTSIIVDTYEVAVHNAPVRGIVDRNPVLDNHLPGAGIGAVMRAGASFLESWATGEGEQEMSLVWRAAR